MNDSTSQARDRNSRRWQIIAVVGILAALGAFLWAWNSSQSTAVAAPAPAATAKHHHHHKAGQKIIVVPAAPAPAAPAPAAVPAAPSGYFAALDAAGIVAPRDWEISTGQRIAAEWRAGASTATTDQELLNGGLRADHLAAMDNAIAAYL